MLKATIIGNLGNDPEMRYSANGAAFLRFNVASNYRARSPEGEWTTLATVVRRTALPAADENFRMWRLGLRVDLETDLVQLRHILSVEPAI